MKVRHPQITSPLFKLIGTHELDISFPIPNDEVDSFTLRIELFVSMEDDHHFRYRSYRTEMYRLRPILGVIGDIDDADNVADVTLFVEHGLTRLPLMEDIKADSPEQALKMILCTLSEALEYITSVDMEYE